VGRGGYRMRGSIPASIPANETLASALRKVKIETWAVLLKRGLDPSKPMGPVPFFSQTRRPALIVLAARAKDG
jgi:hypothetical protein